MAPIEWFYAKGGKHSGPVNSVELKRMAVAGELKPDDLIWREGMAEWTTAKNVRGLFDEEGKPIASASAGAPPKVIDPVGAAMPATAASPAVFSNASPQTRVRHAPPKHVFDMLLEVVRAQFSASFVESTARLFASVGKIGLLAAMGLSVLFAVVVSVKVTPFDSSFLINGAISLLILAVLQYLGVRFCEAGNALNRATNESIGSTVIFDGLAMFLMAAGAAGFLATLFIGFMGLYWLILAGLALFVILIYLAFIAIHPEVVQIKLVAEMRPGAEALGLISFIPKAFVRLAPVVYGVGTLFGSAMLLYACVEVLAGSADVAKFVAMSGTNSLYCCGSFPMIAYLLFLTIYLFLDLCRAVLALPGKLDKSLEQEAKSADES
jgi:hypothetical protein